MVVLDDPSTLNDPDGLSGHETRLPAAGRPRGFQDFEIKAEGADLLSQGQNGNSIFHLPASGSGLTASGGAGTRGRRGWTG